MSKLNKDKLMSTFNAPSKQSTLSFVKPKVKETKNASPSFVGSKKRASTGDLNGPTSKRSSTLASSSSSLDGALVLDGKTRGIVVVSIDDLDGPTSKRSSTLASSSLNGHVGKNNKIDVVSIDDLDGPTSKRSSTLASSSLNGHVGKNNKIDVVSIDDLDGPTSRRSSTLASSSLNGHVGKNNKIDVVSIDDLDGPTSKHIKGNAENAHAMLSGIEDVHYCYILVHKGIIVYVGETHCPRSRFYSHYNDTNVHNQMKAELIQHAKLNNEEIQMIVIYSGTYHGAIECEAAVIKHQRSLTNRGLNMNLVNILKGKTDSIMNEEKHLDDLYAMIVDAMNNSKRFSSFDLHLGPRQIQHCQNYRNIPEVKRRRAEVERTRSAKWYANLDPVRKSKKLEQQNKSTKEWIKNRKAVDPEFIFKERDRMRAYRENRKALDPDYNKKARDRMRASRKKNKESG